MDLEERNDHVLDFFICLLPNNIPHSVQPLGNQRQRFILLVELRMNLIRVFEGAVYRVRKGGISFQLRTQNAGSLSGI